MDKNELRNKIISIMFDGGVFKPGRWRKNKQLFVEIQEFEIADFITVQEKIYALVNENYIRPKCAVCKINFTTFTGISSGYVKNCSASCATKNKDTQAKMKKTMVERFGVEHALQSKEVQDRHKQHNLEKYGVEYTFQVAKFKQDAKDTVLKKYGVEFAQQSEQVKQNKEKTNLEKYGFKTPLLNPEVKKKTQKTNLELYGSDHHLKNPNIREKIKKTHLEKYGVDNPTKCKLVQQKIIDNYSEARLNKIEKSGYELLSPKWTDYNSSHLWRHICGNEFTQIGNIPKCTICKKRSKQQQQILNLLAQNNIGYIEDDKKIIKPYELDFYIPSHDFAIEVNGIYWHHDKRPTLPILQKSKLFNRLLHFWDFEIANEFEFVKNIIFEKAGLNSSLGNSVIEQINSELAVEFMSNNLLKLLYPICESVNSSYYGINDDSGELLYVSKVESDGDDKIIIVDATKSGFSQNEGSRILANHFMASEGKLTYKMGDNRFEFIDQQDNIVPSYFLYKSGIIIREPINNIDDLLNAGWLRAYDCGISKRLVQTN